MAKARVVTGKSRLSNGSKNKKSGSKLASKSTSKSESADFVLTISDTEDVAGMAIESDENLSEDEAEKKKVSKKIEIKSSELNPDFTFSFGEDEISNLDGWNFEVDQPKVKTSVDLDSIIKRAGGLKSDEEEEDDNEDDNEHIAVDLDGGDSDSDELALDGFGMGAEPEDEIVEDDEEDKEDGEDKENEEDDEEDDEDEDETDDLVEKSKHTSDSQDGVEEVPVDTAEEIADFYEAADSEAVHKDFSTLSLSRPILKGLASLGYSKPSPVQSTVIPVALLGKDIVAGAVTGSGKTAAYLIPIVERLLYRPKKIAAIRVIVLTPTRELAIQVSDVGRKISQFVNGLSFGLAVGGLNLRAQEQQLKARPDVVVSTPGRLIDHIRNSASFHVDDVEILVIDEADRMLEEGFQKELTEILTLLPGKRQTLLFSATMNNRIKDLIQLSLHRPVRIMINPPKQAADGLIQEFVRIRKRETQKPAVLYHLLTHFATTQRIIVFVSRKETAHRLRVILGLLGLRIAELHGSLTQEQRLESVQAFKTLEIPVLICTDIASRGLDIPKIEVVINYDIPGSYDIYIHRVGRTARAGRHGRSITFVGEAQADRNIVKQSIKGAKSAGSVIGRNVDWKQIDKIHSDIQEKQELVEQVLKEEKNEKLIIQAERDVTRGENMIKYEEEIKSRPKRTWFETESDKKKDKEKLNKRKTEEDQDAPRRYKKTKMDRETKPVKGKSAKQEKKFVKTRKPGMTGKRPTKTRRK